MNRNAIFPGSFSPIHEGHIDIIKRASKLFDKLYVCMAINENKKSSIDNDMFNKLNDIISKLNIKNVNVIKSEKNIVEIMNDYNCSYIVRSIRDSNDIQYEIDLYDSYTENNEKIDEVIFISKCENRKISSSFFNNRKMFVFDIDGTLLNDKKEINETTCISLEKLKRKGHIISIVTGRTPKQTLSIAKKLSLDGIIVGCGGASAYDILNDKYYVVKNDVPLEAREYILELAKKYKRELIFSDGIENYRVYFGNDPTIDIKDEKFFIGGTSRNPVYNSWDEVSTKFYNSKLIQVAFKAESWIIDEEYNNAIKNLPKGIECFETSRVYLEFSPKGVNKLSGVKFLKNKYKINDNNIYCFGDSMNDEPMISWCINGVAMGNSNEKLKEKAKYIIGSNNDDSINEFLIERGILNE